MILIMALFLLTFAKAVLLTVAPVSQKPQPVESPKFQMQNNSKNNSNKTKMSRRGFFTRAIITTGSIIAGAVLADNKSKSYWQIDPSKCIECELCASECVLKPSAVKCLHQYQKCGYCDLCSGYFIQGATRLDTGAENQLCPTGALQRTFIEEPYFEYLIDEELCIGCGRCVKNCRAFGNASLVLQVRHDLCVNCNQCKIALACPAQAFRKVVEPDLYMLDRQQEAEKT
jgi:electron transport complex protein RnfB